MTTSDSNAPQASPTIQELLDELYKQCQSITSDYERETMAFEEANIAYQTEVKKAKAAILTLFSRIITEARPEKQLDEWNMINPTDKQRQKHWRSGYNDAIDLFERNLRAAIEGKQ